MLFVFFFHDILLASGHWLNIPNKYVVGATQKAETEYINFITRISNALGKNFYTLFKKSKIKLPKNIKLFKQKYYSENRFYKNTLDWRNIYKKSDSVEA